MRTRRLPAVFQSGAAASAWARLCCPSTWHPGTAITAQTELAPFIAAVGFGADAEGFGKVAAKLLARNIITVGDLESTLYSEAISMLRPLKLWRGPASYIRAIEAAAEVKLPTAMVCKSDGVKSQ